MNLPPCACLRLSSMRQSDFPAGQGAYRCPPRRLHSRLPRTARIHLVDLAEQERGECFEMLQSCQSCALALRPCSGRVVHQSSTEPSAASANTNRSEIPLTRRKASLRLFPTRRRAVWRSVRATSAQQRSHTGGADLPSLGMARRSKGAPALRGRTSRVRRTTRAVLAARLQPAGPGDRPPRDAFVDRALVLP